MLSNFSVSKSPDLNLLPITLKIIFYGRRDYRLSSVRTVAGKKSQCFDAILGFAGEQQTKSLRGEMKDVIFSRLRPSPAGMAEVVLYMVAVKPAFDELNCTML